MLIDGEQHSASSTDRIDVVNPASEELVGTVPAGSATDVDLAVAAAKRAVVGGLV